MEKQASLVNFGEVHHGIGDVAIFQFSLERRVVFQFQADVIYRFSLWFGVCRVSPDDVNDWTVTCIEPISRYALDGAWTCSFSQIEEINKKVACLCNIAGADGDVINVHGEPPLLRMVIFVRQPVRS